MYLGMHLLSGFLKGKRFKPVYHANKSYQQMHLSNENIIMNFSTGVLSICAIVMIRSIFEILRDLKRHVV